MRDIQFDATKQGPDAIRNSHRLLLMEAEFVRHLFDAPYPFVDTPRPDMTAERFKKGEALFYEMQCLKCHVLGDGSVAGAQKNPTAPNLTLAHRRLQRRWIRHWVQEPDIIQLQTAMPPFFTGKPVFDPRGQSWARAQSTLRPADQVEADYGKTADEQAALLLDFIYAAGVRGHTGIQPADAPPPTKEVQQRDPAKGVAPTPPATPTQPFLPGDATKGKATEAPAAPVKPPVEMKPVEKSATPKPEVKKTEAKAQSTPGAAAAGDVSIRGVVLLEGTAPVMDVINMADPACANQHADPPTEETIVVGEKNQLKNVALTISAGLPQQNYDPPAEAAVLNQKGCQYLPHVLAVMVGQKIVVKNSDAFLHNVHALASENVPFNFGQPNVAESPIEPLKTPEAFRVKCDVHPWMSAYVVGVDNPFFAVSGDDGSFAIKKLPPGEYTLRAWHERLGTQEIPVKVEAGKPTEIQIKFAAP
jgi:plastocyanin